MRDRYDVIVIGGGVTGALTLRELARYRLSALLLEKGGDLSNGTTRANSAIIHAGYDPEPGTAKAKYNVEGNLQYEQLCRELSLRYERIPSLVVAYSEEQLPTVEKLYRRGLENGVSGLSVVDAERLRELEPNISESARGALLAESSAIVEPWMVAVGAAENAVDNGAEVRVNTRVTAISKKSDGFEIEAETPEGQVEIFLAPRWSTPAGVFADDISAMVTCPIINITRTAGPLLYCWTKEARYLIKQHPFPLPDGHGQGMLIFPKFTEG